METMSHRPYGSPMFPMHHSRQSLLTCKFSCLTPPPTHISEHSCVKNQQYVEDRSGVELYLARC